MLPEHYFRLANGMIIKSIDELPLALERTDNTIFSNHVTPYKNDFAKWIYDVFGLNDLARIIGQTKSKQEIIRILRAYSKQKNYFNILNIQEAVQQQAQQQTLSQKPSANPQQSTNKPKYNTQVQQQSNNESTSQSNTGSGTQQNPQQSVPVAHPIYKWSSQAVSIKKPEPKEHKPMVFKEAKPHQGKEERPKQDKQDETNPDKFFEKNPILTEQAVEAKKKTLKIDLLEQITYDSSMQPDKAAELFKDAYSKAYQKMSEIRKHGFDTSLIEIMIFRIPPKIKIFEATKLEKDAVIVKRYLNEVIEELNNTLKNV